MPEGPPSDRTRVRRRPERGRYAPADVHAILDEGLVCHVGFCVDGQPYVLPTTYGRVGTSLYLHGASTSRMMRTLASGASLSVTVTLLDGLVLARSAFHHSMNYRSVVILGNAVEVTDAKERLEALEAIVAHILPGRWDDVRRPNETEIRATTVLRLPLSEASAKIRSGPPVDDEEDMDHPCWAGEIPLRLAAGAPLPDPALPSDVTPPAAIQSYDRS